MHNTEITNFHIMSHCVCVQNMAVYGSEFYYLPSLGTMQNHAHFLSVALHWMKGLLPYYLMPLPWGMHHTYTISPCNINQCLNVGMLWSILRGLCHNHKGFCRTCVGPYVPQHSNILIGIRQCVCIESLGLSDKQWIHTEMQPHQAPTHVEFIINKNYVS